MLLDGVTNKTIIGIKFLFWVWLNASSPGIWEEIAIKGCVLARIHTATDPDSEASVPKEVPDRLGL